MRTTLTLDDDLAFVLKKRAGELGVPFKKIVNEVIRQGLEQCGEAKRPKKKFKVRPFKFGMKPGIDPDKINQLLSDWDVEDYLSQEAKLRSDQP